MIPGGLDWTGVFCVAILSFGIGHVLGRWLRV